MNTSGVQSPPSPHLPHSSISNITSFNNVTPMTISNLSVSPSVLTPSLHNSVALNVYVYENEDSIDEEFICSICREPFVDPRSHALCQNIFCGKCMQKLKTCPLCRGDITMENSLMVPRPFLNILDRLRVMCVTCKQYYPRGELPNHTANCPVPCPNGCGTAISPKQLPTHELLCQNKIISCVAADVGCPHMCARSTMMDHTTHCSFSQLRPTLLQNQHQIHQLQQQIDHLQQQLKIVHSAQQTMDQQLKQLIHYQQYALANNKDLFPARHAWKWATTSDRKADAVRVDVLGITAERPDAAGHNPALFTSDPLTRANPHCRIKVESLGVWFGIGVADLKFQLNGGTILGVQANCLNCGYFQQNSTKLQMQGEETIDVASPIASGDIIDVYVDFNRNRIFFWKNEIYQGSIHPRKTVFRDGEIYPVANFSANTKIMLSNNDFPNIRPVEKMNGYSWKWSREKKSALVNISADALTASRPSTQGSNPSIMTSDALTVERPHFRVQIKKLGAWIGIGVADNKLKLEGGSILGVQPEGANAAYFCQTDPKLQMRGEDTIKASRIQLNDIIDVYVVYPKPKP